MPKVSALTAASTPLAGTETVYLVQSGNSRKATVNDIWDADRSVSRVKLQTAVVAAGQTELEQTGIPSWANRVTVIASLLSTSGTNDILLQIGDGAYVTTGYVSHNQNFTGSGLATVTSTAGFLVDNDGAAGQVTGRFTLSRQSGNIWVMDGMFRRSSGSMGVTVGELTLTGALDRLRATTVGGTDTFDAGSFAVSWE